MAWTLLTSLTATPGANGGTTSAIDTTGANLIVANVVWYASAPNPTWSDSKSNTWLEVITGGGPGLSVGGLVYQKFFYAKNPTVGTGHTFTVSGLGEYTVLTVWAFSGSNITAPLDQSAGSSRGLTGVGPLACGSITPSVSNCLIVSGWCGFNSTSNPTVDSGMTQTTSQNPVAGTCVAGGAAYLFQGAAASINPNWNWTGTDYACCGVASFLPSTGVVPNITPPVYPDFVLRAQMPMAQMQASTLPPYVPVTDERWEGVYPDRIPPPLALPVHQQLAFQASSLPIVAVAPIQVGWLGTASPMPAPPVVSPLRGEGSFTTTWGVTAEQLISQIFGGLIPGYPDQLRLPSRVLPGVSVIPPLYSAQAVSPLSWEPQYPDMIARPRQSVPGDGVGPLSGAIVATNDLRWLSTYPAQIPAPFNPQQAGYATFLRAFPDLPWWPAYPDLLRRAQLNVGQPFSFYPSPVAGPAPPGLGFQTTLYPSQIAQPPSLLNAQRQTVVMNLLPLPNAPAPAGYPGWLPIYPNPPLGRALTEGHGDLGRKIQASGGGGAGGGGGGHEPTNIANQLRFRAIYPDQVWRPAYPSSLFVIGGSFANYPALPLPELEKWQPLLPDRLVVPVSRLYTADGTGTFVYYVPYPPTVVSKIETIRLTYEMKAVPSLGGELSGVSKLTYELFSPGNLGMLQ